MPKISSYANVTPVAGDQFLITDASDSNATKNVLYSALEADLLASPTLTGLPVIGNATTTAIPFNISGAEVARIDSSGNFLVGKTVSGLSVSGVEITQDDVQATKDGGPALYVNRNVDDGPLVHFYQDNILHGSISIAGSTTSYNTTSDYRLKENVEPLTGATERLKQIPVSRFNFKASPEKMVDGFLAHEVQGIVPEAVTGEKDAVDGDGNPVFQQIDQSKLVPLLVATIQELETRIAALEA